jgi:hypothetical protein
MDDKTTNTPNDPTTDSEDEVKGYDLGISSGLGLGKGAHPVTSTPLPHQSTPLPRQSTPLPTTSSGGTGAVDPITDPTVGIGSDIKPESQKP